MPEEKAINKVIYGGNTLMDITDTTATESDVVSGEIFYLANGTRGVGTANYISTETDPTVPSWAKETNPPSYTLTYDQNSSVGSAQVGTAVTGTANYTPSGDISIINKKQTINIPTDINQYIGNVAYDNGYWMTYNITYRVELIRILVPKNISFTGSGVNFIIERDDS